MTYTRRSKRHAWALLKRSYQAAFSILMLLVPLHYKPFCFRFSDNLKQVSAG
jgi:hypothetical protein